MWSELVSWQRILHQNGLIEYPRPEKLAAKAPEINGLEHVFPIVTCPFLGDMLIFGGCVDQCPFRITPETAGPTKSGDPKMFRNLTPAAVDGL